MGRREQLLARKEDLLSAIRVLEQDRQDGAIDEEAYRVARAQCEAEAVSVLQELDRVAAPPLPPRRSHWSGRVMGGVAVVVVAAALALFLATAVHPRSAASSITGDVPTPAAAPTSASQPAYAALLAQGNAAVQAGDAATADKRYLAAMKLDPSRPEAPTLHAMMLGSIGEYPAALELLRRVEALHPRYARGWLLDGLLAAHSQAGYPRAVASWKRFLALQPSGAPAARVHSWLSNVEKSLKGAKS